MLMPPNALPSTAPWATSTAVASAAVVVLMSLADFAENMPVKRPVMPPSDLRRPSLVALLHSLPYDDPPNTKLSRDGVTLPEGSDRPSAVGRSTP